MVDFGSVVSMDINDVDQRENLPRSPNLSSPRPKVYKRKPIKSIDLDDESLIIDEIKPDIVSPPDSRSASRLGKNRSKKSPIRSPVFQSSSGSVDSLVLSDSEDVAPCYHRKNSYVGADNESACVSSEPDCYRSSILGTKYRRVRFDDDGKAVEDKAAAKSVEQYFRKWKMRTIFQTLEIYRAQRRQEFIYFTQQVHLYNQEVKARQDQINMTLNLLGVREEAAGAHRLILNRSPSLLRKFPLDHTLDAYFDTSFLCEQLREEELDWEKPFKDATKHTDQELSATIKKLDVKYDSVKQNRNGSQEDDNLSTVSSGCGRYSEGSGILRSSPGGSRGSTPTSPRPILKKHGNRN